MIRTALRQLRTEAAIGAGCLAVLAVVLALTEPQLAQVNDAFQRACSAARDCATATNPVAQVDPGLATLVDMFALVAPVLVGLFFGAPLLAGELESGTFRLAWTQSVTHRRWLSVKLGLVGATAVVMSALLVWMVDWWQAPLDAGARNGFSPVDFGFHGVVLVGYAVFAFALGVAAGTLLRRTVTAMAATLAGFLAARIAVTNWVRPILAPPLHESLSLAKTGFGTLSVSPSPGTTSLLPPAVLMPNFWVYQTSVVNSSGATLSARELLQACPGYGQLAETKVPPTLAEMVRIHHDCLARLSQATYHTLVVYQPSSRFWPFQWAELAIFAVAALALCGLVYWWLHRCYA